MTQTFLAIGEAMVEMAPDGAGHFAMGFAGDTLNTAWYLRRLAGDAVAVHYFSAIGADEVSGRMAAFIRGAGIDPELTVIPERTVGLYMISLKDGERSFSYWRDTSAAKLLARGLDRLPAVGGPGDMAYFSGITLAILSEEDRETLLDALAAARAAGVTVAFDPNLRPRLWPDTDTMCRWITRGAAAADIVLPSFDEEALHFGDADPTVTRTRYRDGGSATVIVKDGPKPVHATGPDGEVTVETPPVAQVVDTTAAGDSFNAGTLAALMQGASLEAAIAEGCRVSGRVIGARGALVEGAA